MLFLCGRLHEQVCPDPGWAAVYFHVLSSNFYWINYLYDTRAVANGTSAWLENTITDSQPLRYIPCGLYRIYAMGC